ncbi:hypothetical protein [Actinokineospora enzanensis]|nr:hypothetical protein [Actinokineospora enzanensis]
MATRRSGMPPWAGRATAMVGRSALVARLQALLVVRPAAAAGRCTG